jgi:hypothetical protein
MGPSSIFQLGEFAEVLDGCREVELVLGAVGSSEAEAVEADDAFEVREQHLDLLPGVARRDISIGPGNIPRLLAGALVPRPGDLPGGLVGRASGLQQAGSAILFPGKVLLEPSLPNSGRPFEMFRQYGFSTRPPGHRYSSAP